MERPAQAIGGPLVISGPAGGTDTGAAIRPAAKQLALWLRVARNGPHVGHPISRAFENWIWKAV